MSVLTKLIKIVEICSSHRMSGLATDRSMRLTAEVQDLAHEVKGDLDWHQVIYGYPENETNLYLCWVPSLTGFNTQVLQLDSMGFSNSNGVYMPVSHWKELGDGPVIPASEIGLVKL